ncbi:MAG: hypothetical protein KatS3mg076_1612 [Candidatus Binatia bacterium]|nr:MAG: hypothetical protein KatS3mg076_1612 [Candidatus Binatia bacterium]
MDDRTEVLEKLRRLCEEGSPTHRARKSTPSRPGSEATLPQEFRSEIEALGGELYEEPDEAAALERCASILREAGARRIVAWSSPLVEGLASVLSPEAAVRTPEGDIARWREECFEAQAGVTEADFGIAETGTLVLADGPGRSRLASLTPPLHVALLRRTRLLANLGAFFDLLAREPDWKGRFLTFVTGPSRTADIEKKLVLGVHGPERLAVVLHG